MRRPAEANIDLRAFGHNLRQVRQLAPDSRVMAVVKADAYGHGMVQAAAALAEADAFAVATLGEGEALRQAGVTKPLVVLQGVMNGSELRRAARLRLQPVLHQAWQVELLERETLGLPIDLWLKLDTGMHRFGLPVEQAAEIVARLRSCRKVHALRLMSHMACADVPEDPATEAQIARFLSATDTLGLEASLANSATLLAFPHARREWVRPGLMLYGVTPFLDRRRAAELRPVMQLRTRLIAINRHNGGDAIGYGATWRCPETMPVGIAAIGYGDGYPRHAPSGTPVLVNGQRTQIVGRVSMDAITIDLRGIDAEIGAEVELWGPGVDVAEVAQACGTIPYELLCSVACRVEHRYLD